MDIRAIALGLRSQGDVRLRSTPNVNNNAKRRIRNVLEPLTGVKGQDLNRIEANNGRLLSNQAIDQFPLGSLQSRADQRIYQRTEAYGEQISKFSGPELIVGPSALTIKGFGRQQYFRGGSKPKIQETSLRLKEHSFHSQYSFSRRESEPTEIEGNKDMGTRVQLQTLAKQQAVQPWLNQDKIQSEIDLNQWKAQAEVILNRQIRIKKPNKEQHPNDTSKRTITQKVTLNEEQPNYQVDDNTTPSLNHKSKSTLGLHPPTTQHFLQNKLAERSKPSSEYLKTINVADDITPYQQNTFELPVNELQFLAGQPTVNLAKPPQTTKQGMRQQNRQLEEWRQTLNGEQEPQLPTKGRLFVSTSPMTSKDVHHIINESDEKVAMKPIYKIAHNTHTVKQRAQLQKSQYLSSSQECSQNANVIPHEQHNLVSLSESHCFEANANQRCIKCLKLQAIASPSRTLQHNRNSQLAPHYNQLQYFKLNISKPKPIEPQQEDWGEYDKDLAENMVTSIYSITQCVESMRSRRKSSIFSMADEAGE